MKWYEKTLVVTVVIVLLIVFSSCITMNTAVGTFPISRILKSLLDNISESCSRLANKRIFCLNTESIPPFVSVGEFIVLDANTYGVLDSPFKLKYSLMQ